MARLTRENLLAFLERDWDLARHVKDGGVARWSRKNGTTATLRLAQALLDQVWVRRLAAQRRDHDVSGILQLTDKLARARAAGR